MAGGISTSGMALVFLWASLALTQAVVFYSTADPSYNTTPPTGNLAGSGWDYQGSWGAFLGTPIAPQCFITAKHIGGVEGDSFVFAGQTYVTIAFYDDPASDLRMWRIRGAFPYVASCYERADERSRLLVVFGRGTQRGDPIILTNRFGSALKGWKWGTIDGVKRWGQSTVYNIATNSADQNEFLQMLFRAGSLTNETDVSGGDSGGGLFINDGGGWKLAGINHGIRGPYNTNDTGGGFYACVFDEGGLYVQDNSVWSFIPELLFTEQPGVFYATRISSRLGWINQVVAGAIPPASPLLAWSERVEGPYSPDPTATLDLDAGKITIPRPSSTRFYQVQGGAAWTMGAIQVAGDNLVITYF
jgi:hypothetical protein